MTKSGGVVQNIPPGVPPILGTTQYIMSQTPGGLQYYQPPVFSYEDAAIQVIQQRIPPHHVVNVSKGFIFIKKKKNTAVS